jgi:hypothetical protein
MATFRGGNNLNRFNALLWMARSTPGHGVGGGTGQPKGWTVLVGSRRIALRPWFAVACLAVAAYFAFAPALFTPDI